MFVLIALLYLSGFVTFAHWWRGTEVPRSIASPANRRSMLPDLEIDLREQPHANAAPSLAH